MLLDLLLLAKPDIVCFRLFSDVRVSHKERIIVLGSLASILTGNCIVLSMGMLDSCRDVGCERLGMTYC